MKGTAWGNLMGAVKEGYRQVSTRTASGRPSGKFVADSRTAEFATNVAGSHGGTPSGKFCGPTKGNKDLPINRSSNVPGGMGGGQHKAGG